MPYSRQAVHVNLMTVGRGLTCGNGNVRTKLTAYGLYDVTSDM